MAHKDFTEDNATLFGSGMITVGLLGSTSAITKGICAVTATKAGVLVGSLLNPPVAVGVGLLCVGVGIIHHCSKLDWW